MKAINEVEFDFFMREFEHDPEFESEWIKQHLLYLGG